MTGSISPPAPLAYEGQVVVPYINRTFDPSSSNNTFPIPTVWINTALSLAWICVSKASGVAVWLPIGGGSTQIGSITTPDSQIVSPTNGNINFLQSGPINITGNSPANSDVFFTVSGGGLVWTDVTGTTQAMSENNGYVSDNSAIVTLTLPTISAFGSVIAVAGKGSGGWKIAQNSGQQIKCGLNSTTLGTSGSISSTNANDCIYILCTTANDSFTMINSVGNLTLV